MKYLFLYGFALYAGSVVAASSAQTNLNCPSQDFRAFYEIVRSTRSLQSQFLNFPIAHKEIDQLENGRIVNLPPYANLARLLASKKTIFPTNDEILKEKLKFIFHSNSAQPTVAVIIDDTDAESDFVFRKMKSCFYLVEIIDK